MIDFKIAIAKSDIETIAHLAEIIWREHYIPIANEAQVNYMIANFQSVNAIQNQIKNGYQYYIVYNVQEPIGYISYIPEQEFMFLSKIYILKSVRGKGIAKQSIQFITQKTLEQHLKGIRLTVYKKNAEALAAYSKLGFINMGEKITDIGNGFIMDDFEMIKPL